MEGWRIVKRKNAKTAFTGEGARRFGGRWNSPGKPAVYLAGSQSLAILEMLAHLCGTDLLDRYVLFQAEWEESLTDHLAMDDLPRNWRSYPAPRKVQAAGDAWLVKCSHPVLRVPSAIVPAESNYLLNPAHPEFARVAIAEPVPYRFDSRLLP